MKKDRLFEIGKTKFEVCPIPPMRAWEISELIREALGRPGVLETDISISVPDIKANPAEALKAVLAVLAKLQRQDVLNIREALFEFVKFKDPEQVKPLTLLGAEDMAFAELDFTAIYEVLGRAFFVNFTGSLTDLTSRLGLGAGDQKEDSGSTQSEPGQSLSSSPSQ